MTAKMTFPLLYILLPFAAVLVVFAIFTLVDILHLAHYGASNAVGFLATLVFLVGTVAIFGSTFMLLQNTDWSQPVMIGLTTSLPSSMP